MTRARQLIRGVLALLAVAVLVAGPPWALLHYLGNPLPHHLPSWAQLRTGLTAHQIPEQVLLDVLALAVWAGWALLVASLAAETVAAVQGRAAPRLPAAEPLQPVAAALVTAIMVAVVSMVSRQPPAVAVPLAATVPRVSPAVTLFVPTAEQHVIAANSEPAASSPNGDRDPSRSTNARWAERASHQYVVQRRDTLWGIAVTQLGDPYRWPQIWELNRGRVMPDGRTFTDPNRIWPGWSLDLPTKATAPANGQPAEHRPNRSPHGEQHGRPHKAHKPQKPASHPAPRTPEPTRQPTVPAEPASTAPPATTTPPASSASSGHDHGGDAIPVVPETLIGLSLAAGVSAAVAAARLRRRRRYHPHQPAPGVDGTDTLVGPLAAQLRRYKLTAAAQDDTAYVRPGEAASLPPPQPQCDSDSATRPPGTDVSPIGVLDVGAHSDGRPVRLNLPALGELRLAGPGALPAARALVLAWLTHTAADRAELLVAGPDVAADIASDLARLPGVTVTQDLSAALTRLERELLTRARLLDDNDTRDFASFTTACPGEPLPALLLLTRGDLTQHRQRLAAVLDAGRRVGIAGIHLDNRADPSNAGTVATDGLVTAAPAGVPQLSGARMPVLDSLQGDELARLLLTARVEQDPTPQSLDTATPPAAPQPAASVETPPPPVETHPAGEWSSAGPGHPVQLTVFGAPRIISSGTELDTGLRTKARELAVFLLLHPAGVGDEPVVDALWPDAAPGRGIEYFRTALGNLRKALRTATRLTDAMFVDRVAGRYRLDPHLVDADLWRFQAALTDAARASDDHERRDALERAAAAYTGDLAADTPYEWVEPYREDLRRRALDVYARLADMYADGGDLQRAADSLEQAVGHDPYAEELARRLITVYRQLRRPDAARRVYQGLESRLAELDVDPDPGTTALLTGPAPAGPAAAADRTSARTLGDRRRDAAAGTRMP